MSSRLAYEGRSFNVVTGLLEDAQKDALTIRSLQPFAVQSGSVVKCTTNPGVALHY